MGFKKLNNLAKKLLVHIFSLFRCLSTYDTIGLNVVVAAAHTEST